VITDKGYIAIIDNNYISDNFTFFVEEIIITRQMLNKKNKVVPLEDLKLLHYDGSFYLFLLSGSSIFTVEMKHNNLTHYTTSSSYSAAWDFVSGLNVFVIYLASIIIISIVIFYFKRRQANNNNKVKPKSFSEDGNINYNLYLDEMISKVINEFKNVQEKKNQIIGGSSFNKNKKFNKED